MVVVDNGSTDGTAEMMREKYSDFTLMEMDANLGFGRALDLAIGQYGDGPILLLNNDVVLEEGFVAEMTATAAGGSPMVAGVLTRSDEPGIIDSAGVIADSRTLMAFDYLEGAPIEAVLNAGPPLGPTGGAGLYDRTAFNQAGGFDPRIFAYYEDLDLALRMRLDGCRCVLAPRARGSHMRSSTLGARSASKYALTGWSRGYLLRRYGIMDSLPRLVRTVVYDGCVCAGQIVMDHTFSGLRGRFRGWQAAGSLEKRPRPASGLSRISVRAAIRARIKRYL